MGTRTLLGFIVVIAVLFASALTGSAAASAATMRHDKQMMEMGHCFSPPSSRHDGKGLAKNCCMAMCMAVAIAPAVPAQPNEIQHQATYFAVPKSWHGYLGEIATPPPRLA